MNGSLPQVRVPGGLVQIVAGFGAGSALQAGVHHHWLLLAWRLGWALAVVLMYAEQERHRKRGME